jgi:hypothetical protein
VILLQRDDGRDLQFEGEIIGEGTWGGGTTNKVHITIYRVKDTETEPRYVVSSQVTYRPIAGRPAEVRHAKVCVGPKAVLEALMQQGRLGRPSKDAWEDACDNDPDLSDERYETL